MKTKSWSVQSDFSCLATIVAIKNETGQWRWALFAAGYTTALAWIVSALVALV